MKQPVFDEKTIKVILSVLKTREEVFFSTLEHEVSAAKEDLTEEDLEMYEAVKLLVSNYSTSCQQLVSAMLTYDNYVEEEVNKNQMNIDEFLK